MPVVPRTTTGIISVGRKELVVSPHGEDHPPVIRSMLSSAMCHATLTGVEGAELLHEFSGRIKGAVM